MKLRQSTKKGRREYAGRYLLLIFAMLMALSSKAAPDEVSGTVKDEEGMELIGATVREKGTRLGTVTDVEGRFTLKLTTKRPVLEISYVGFKSMEVPVTGKEISIIMKSTSESLDEVVVVAYGVQKKETVTGSISSVDSKEILKSSQPNVSTALSGKLPGLTISQNNGAPGKDDVTMYLRGAATSNDTNPLILVDGIPRTSIREIDANEIATISVLKDASATAVFGVRGANGVILITTKRGSEGKVKVSGSIRYSRQEFTTTPFLYDSWDYARMLNEARYNDDPTQGPYFTDEEIALFDTWRDGEGPSDPQQRYWYPNTDWQKIYFKDHSNMVNANVNVSGGTQRLRYFVNAGYVYQGGMLNIESKKALGYDSQPKLNRYNLRSNLDYQFSGMVKASLDVSSFIEKVNGPNCNGPEEGAIWGDAITERTTTPGPLTDPEMWLRSNETDENGKVIISHPVGNMIVKDPAQTLQSGYGNMNRRGYRLETRSGLNAIGNVVIDLGCLTPGLSLKGLASFESRGNSTTSANKAYVTYGFERNPAGLDLPGVYTFDGASQEDGDISLSKSAVSWWFLNLQAQANYNRTFNERHAVTGMVLFQRDIRENNAGAIPFNMIGLASRATYAYDSRYMAEVNIGYNGTEQFAKGHRFGFFPAFSLGWVLTNEPFMAHISGGGILQNLKLRASVGKVGNDGLGGERFLYLDQIVVDTTPGNVLSLGNNTTVRIDRLGNPLISWETAWKQNYAIDLRLFNSLDLTFDYFLEDRNDILMKRRTVSMTGGFSSNELPKTNLGKIKNRGFEISALYRLHLGENFSMGINGNLSYNNNKVIQADEPLLSEEYTYRRRETGFPLGQGWGYLIDYSCGDGSGFFNSQEQIDSSGLSYEVGGGKPHPGDFIYKDINGDGVIDERDLAPMQDAQLVPKITYGFGLNAYFKGLDFSVMFQGIGKYKRYYGSNGSGRGIFEENAPNYFSDFNGERWSEARYAAGEKITSPRLTIGGSTSHVPNEYYYFDASYTRLKNIELGYTIPVSVTRHAGISSLRLYVSGDNVYTWAHMKTKSFDPEQASILDYPLLRSWNVGLNIEF